MNEVKHTPPVDFRMGVCIMEECTLVKNADGQEKLTEERDAFRAIECASKNGELKTLKNTRSLKKDISRNLKQREKIYLMQYAAGTDQQKKMQNISVSEKNGFYSEMSKEASLLSCLSKAAENAIIVEKKLEQDLHRLTQGALTMLSHAQKVDYTQSRIWSSAVAYATLSNQINNMKAEAKS